MNLRLFLKLATLPFRRSWFLLSLMILSFAQVMLALWFCGGIQKEIIFTQDYARDAHFMTIQLKSDTSPTEPILDAFSAYTVSFEELKTEDVLKKMETEEPEIVQTVRATGNEGMQLMPRVLLVRGVFPESVTEKIRLMPEVYRVDISPVHHARLLSFYRHLSSELRIAIFLIMFMVLVQLLVFERIQKRDLSDGFRNLVMWGGGSLQSRLPAFLSLVVLSLLSFGISIGEWIGFQRTIWKDNAFLGELSLSHEISLPYPICAMTLIAILALGFILNFSGRTSDE